MTNRTNHIISLEQASRSHAQLVGSKAANLGGLLRLGLPVPSGFCVTTSAYEHFITKAHIAEDLLQLSRETQKDPSLVSSWARELIVKSFMPGDLKLEIERCCLALTDGRTFKPDHGFAVRSSAVDEDADSESFAGIHESYLNVTGVECVSARLQDCWASFWSEQALIYRQVHGLLDRKISGAVIIQEMLQGQAAGVLFTIDPANGNRSSLIIEAHAGTGEELVSGAVTPQRYTLQRTPLRIASKYLGRSDNQSTAADRQLATSTVVGQDTVLSDAEILELAQFGITIEKFY